MIIIGEKINGSIPSTAKAIAERDEAFIRNLAVKQSEFNADYLDVCAGTSPDIERDTLKWLIDIVQDTVDTPICIDSSSIDVILEMMELCKKPGMINSVSEENGKCEQLMPKIANTDWKLIALTCDNNGIPTDVQVKVNIATSIMEKAKSYGISQDRMFIDPLVMTIGTTTEAMVNFNESLKQIKDKYPQVHITSGLSNISFGMPCRKIINQMFLCMAMSAGMDSAIMDPTSLDMRNTLYTTQMLRGDDEYCMEYLSAYREGTIGAPPKV